MGKYVRHALAALEQGVHGQHTTDVVGFRPNGKQLLQVTFLQRIVKSIFGFLRFEVIIEEQGTHHDYLLLNVACPHTRITLYRSGGKIA